MQRSSGSKHSSGKSHGRGDRNDGGRDKDSKRVGHGAERSRISFTIARATEDKRAADKYWLMPGSRVDLQIHQFICLRQNKNLKKKLQARHN